MLKQPEPASSELTARMLEYLEEHMKSVHNAVMGISGEDYQKYIDVDSWIDYIIIQEITKNIDGNFKTSCYLYKQSQDDRLYMTAIWDFDIAFGLTAFNNASAEHNDVEDCVGGRGPVGFIAINSSAPWFNALYHNYPDFQARFKQRYKEYRSTLIPEFLHLSTNRRRIYTIALPQPKKNGKRTLITASIFSPIGLRDELNGWILNCSTDRAELPILIML